MRIGPFRAALVRHRSALTIRVSILVLLVLTTLPARADTFTGKVVGITDGDTISVLRSGRAVKIRLDGIDCPEKGDAFSNSAKRFTSKLAFGKEVKVRQTDTDRYGRIVARVMVNDVDLSVALVQAGLAWHYVKYSSDPVLARAEVAARKAKVGVWSQPNPRPPWELRQERRSGGASRAEVAPGNSGAAMFHGNERSRAFHSPSCQHYNCKNCVVVFKSRTEAIAAGYRPGGCCRP